MIDKLKPEYIVELGTHYGVSFFSFCEAAETLATNTFTYAIDTWEGDSQAGYYNNEVYERVYEHFNSRHKTRGRLIRSTFDEAAEHFENNTIDIVHIDGLHTYEAVSHDYNKWKSKLKEGGTMMFHDWNVREKDFGVWKLWEEIKSKGEFHCIEITNGHGLAIATKTIQKPIWHDELIEILPVLKAKGCLLDELRRTKEKLAIANLRNEGQKKREEQLNLHTSELTKQIKEKEKVLNIYKKGLAYRILRKVKSILKKRVG
ncbi:class I SAM-dependent methyltransferase [Synechococcus sp. MU1643]|uniref:class I SAM-dependent methyltransferase n=1 Tax=Synechococcus sp. MU1643 TaxID=2508349 RepID=UPI001CF7EFF6|nr:class I SAM-dependent methyltransferase [Synechococcus sp. MU1643]